MTLTYDNAPTIAFGRRPAKHRAFLVIIRCGSSERPCLFRNELPQDRNFDLAVNYFAPPHPGDAMFKSAEYLVAGGYSKYHAAQQMFAEIGVDTYEGVVFLDDDIDLHFDPREYLDYCRNHGFAMAQPALTPSSDSAWKIVYHHPSFEYRLTNFVEIMAPYLSRAFLRNVIGSFDLSISTYGLDAFWGAQLEQDQPAAIIDRFLMSHERRRDLSDGAFYSYLRSIGVDCFQEMKYMLDLLGMPAYDIQFKGGIPVPESLRVG